LQEGHARVEHPVLQDRVVGVARHEQHLHLGTLWGQALGQLAAAHAREHHVGQQQVDARSVLLADQQRLTAVGRVEHDVAAAPQDPARERAQLVVRFFCLISN